MGARAGTLIYMDQENNQTPVTPEVETIEAVVTEELLIEEISIDGMCGVY